MVDFEVPANPGWNARYREKHGVSEDDVQVVSPAFRRAIQKGQLRAQLMKAASETPHDFAVNPVPSDDVIADHEQTIA